MSLPRPFALWLSFDRWSSSSGRLLILNRVFVGARWTPVVTVRRRYAWRSIWNGTWPQRMEPAE